MFRQRSLSWITPVVASAALAVMGGTGFTQEHHHSGGGGHAVHAAPSHAGGWHGGTAHTWHGGTTTWRHESQPWHGGHRYYGNYGLGLGFGYYPWSYGYNSYPYYPSYSYSYVTPYDYGYTPYYGTAYPYTAYTMPDTAGLYESSTDYAMPAEVDVRLPRTDATVWVEGAKTEQTGALREFVSPPLVPGRRYTYTIRARWTDVNGTEVDMTRDVPVRAGGQVTVDFTEQGQPQKTASAGY